MENAMHLFYPLKWDKTYAAFGKTNMYLITQKSSCKPNDSVNNPSANLVTDFPCEIKSQVTKKCSNLAVKTLE